MKKTKLSPLADFLALIGVLVGMLLIPKALDLYYADQDMVSAWLVLTLSGCLFCYGWEWHHDNRQ